MTELTDREIEAIAVMTAEKLTAQYKQFWVDRETHYEDHLWLKEMREQQKINRDFKRKVIQSATIWALLAVLAFTASSWWHELVNAIKNTSAG